MKGTKSVWLSTFQGEVWLIRISVALYSEIRSQKLKLEILTLSDKNTFINLGKQDSFNYWFLKHPDRIEVESLQPDILRVINSGQAPL
jgi:hypothetical protein